MKQLLILLLCLTSWAGGALALELEGKDKEREIQRYHNDSKSIGSIVRLSSQSLQVSEEGERWSFQLKGEKEQLWLGHPDGTAYVSLDVEKINPKFKYQGVEFKLKLGLTQYSPVEKPALYDRYAGDDKERFYFHSFLFSIDLGDFTPFTESWQEPEVFGLNWYYYSYFVYQTDRLGLDWNWNESHRISLTQGEINRVWPLDYDLDKKESRLIYQWREPMKLGENFTWKLAELKFERLTILGQDQDSLTLTNRLEFKLWGAKHFLNYSLESANSITTYREDLYKYSLVEEYEDKSDLIQELKYTAFTPILLEGLFLAWGYKVTDSLLEQAILDQQIHLSISYVWK